MEPTELSIIDNCDGCGACCLEQQAPPGYSMLLNSPELMANPEAFAADVARLRLLPQEAIDELRVYLKDLSAGIENPNPACIWLDQSTMKCRHYENRPSICREFEVGDDDCRGWRRQYQTVQ